MSEVIILDGSLRTWNQAGLPTSKAFSPRPSTTVSFFPPSSTPRLFPANPGFTAVTDRVVEVVTKGEGSTKVTLADVRSWDEYTGKKHQYKFFSNLGRIPGSRWARWGPSTYRGGDFWCTETGRLHCLDQVAALWANLGIKKPTNPKEGVIFYCGSGWRSGWAWFLARVMGWENISNYDGGFLEYSLTHPRAPNHPIDRSPKPNRPPPHVILHKISPRVSPTKVGGVTQSRQDESKRGEWDRRWMVRRWLIEINMPA